jgi:hypothetical protein
MVTSRRLPFLQPIAYTPKRAEDLDASIRGPVSMGHMSPDLLLQITRTVVSKIDSDAVEEELRAHCDKFCIRLAKDHLHIAGFRAVTGVVHAYKRCVIEDSKLTGAATSLVPSALSEVILGLSAVHADWSLVPHAPALTYLPIMLAARRREHPSLIPGFKRLKTPLPTEDQVRETREFAYAIGRVIRDLQTIRVPRDALSAQLFAVGNVALCSFLQYYEQAIAGEVDFAAASRDLHDGQEYVARLHQAMQYDLGREAGEPAIFVPSLDLTQHPVILAGVACESAVEDVRLRGDMKALLVDALRSLSPQQRTAWFFRKVVRLSDEAGAREMHVDKHTYCTHVDRAITAIERHEYVGVVMRAAETCEDKPLFLDLVSLFLSAEAYEALASPMAGGEGRHQRLSV